MTCFWNYSSAQRIFKIALHDFGAIFDLDSKRQRLEKLEELTADPTLWNDQDRAQKLLKEQKDLKAMLESVKRPGGAIDDALVLIELGLEAEDESVISEVEELLEAAGVGLDALELQRMLGGPHDQSSAIVHINAGAGGTESLDWAGMLFRMYLRFCDIKEWKTQIIDQMDGDEAGIKSATFTVDGLFAYGMLKAESGVHRLVRISPFDASARRHTTFASVSVIPELDDDIDIEVKDSDIKIDTYRAGGAGGQHVNKTDSAVRLTHLESGIVVQCQNERSQLKNRSMAMKVLKARLYDLELKKREEEAAVLHASKDESSFGNQIRSYVLHPYRMVKDHRTGVEVGNADAVLDGEIEGFINAFLMQRGH